METFLIIRKLLVFNFLEKGRNAQKENRWEDSSKHEPSSCTKRSGHVKPNIRHLSVKSGKKQNNSIGGACGGPDSHTNMLYTFHKTSLNNKILYRSVLFGERIGESFRNPFRNTDRLHKHTHSIRQCANKRNEFIAHALARETLTNEKPKAKKWTAHILQWGKDSSWPLLKLHSNP